MTERNVLQYHDTTGELGVTYDYRVYANGLADQSSASAIATAQFPSEPVDKAAPMVAFIAPADGAQVSGNVSVVADVADNKSLEYVEISVSPSGGKSVLCSQSPGGATSVTLSCSWNTKRLALGNYTLTGYAYDSLGNWAQQSVTVILVDGGGTGGGGGGKSGGKGKP